MYSVLHGKIEKNIKTNNHLKGLHMKRILQTSEGDSVESSHTFGPFQLSLRVLLAVS